MPSPGSMRGYKNAKDMFSGTEKKYENSLVTKWEARKDTKAPMMKIGLNICFWNVNRAKPM